MDFVGGGVCVGADTDDHGADGWRKRKEDRRN